MNNFIQLGERFNARQWLIWLLLGLLLLLGLFALLFSVARGDERGLKPFRPSPTPGALIINGQPLLPTFPELNEEPLSFRNKRIRVMGAYKPLPLPECSFYSGPNSRWALVAEELQLNAIGFEPVLRLVPPGVSLTVEGIWRLYEGPLGCGKEPPPDQAWYLEVERIVQPNPLPVFSGTPDIDGATIATPTDQFTPTPGATGSPTPDTSTPTATGAGTATATPTRPLTITPTATFAGTTTATPGGPTVTATPTGITTTPTITATPQQGTPTATSTSTTTSTPGATQPPLATATPGGGYPGPVPTNTPTPGSYP
jgi:hypothetical protein